MKVLLLPNNTASLHKITADGLNKIEGVRATVYSNSSHKYINNDGVIHFSVPLFKINPLIHVVQRLKQFFTLLIEIYKADVLHWGANMLTPTWFWVFYLNLLKKPGIIEFYGSDIRDPQILSKINPFYKNEVESGNYPYFFNESKVKDNNQQLFFSKLKFLCYSAPEMFLYINKENFNKSGVLFQRINLNDIILQYPKIDNNCPTLIHAPSSKGAKGSIYVEHVIEKLKKRYYFKYETIHNVSKKEAEIKIASADIFIDQFIGGSYGLAACEAMSMGKPTLCYIMPEVFNNGVPEECPIVNCSIHTMEEELIKLLVNPQLRHDIGVKSRAYVEKYHDADKIALQLVEIYKQAIELKRGKK